MLKITTNEIDNVTIIKFSGDFYLSSIKDVEDIWNQVLEKKPRIVAFDCKKLDFIDSSAIGTMVKFLNIASGSNVSMVFIDLSASLQKLFDTAKLNRVFSITTWKEFKKKYLSETPAHH